MTYTYCHRFALEGKHQAPLTSCVVKALLLTSSSTMKIYLETILCALWHKAPLKKTWSLFSVILWEFCCIQCTVRDATQTDFTWNKTDLMPLTIQHLLKFQLMWKSKFFQRSWCKYFIHVKDVDEKFHKVYLNMLYIIMFKINVCLITAEGCCIKIQIFALWKTGSERKNAC